MGQDEVLLLVAVVQVVLLGRYCWTWSDRYFSPDRVMRANRTIDLGASLRTRAYGALWLALVVINVMVWLLVLLPRFGKSSKVTLTMGIDLFEVGFVVGGALALAIALAGRPRFLTPPLWRQAIRESDRP